MSAMSLLGTLVADRIGRLRVAFMMLHRSVHDRVAEIIGSAAADVVRQAIRAALEPSAPTALASVTRRDTYDPRGGREADDWADDHDLVSDGGQDAWDYQPPASPPEAASPGLPRLAAAAVVALEVAAWWLAARRGWGCVIAGLSAGVAAYALGPTALTVAPAVAALSLAARSTEYMNILSV